MYIKYIFLFLRSGCTFHICFGIKILSLIHSEIAVEDLLQSTTWSFWTFFFCFSYSRQFGACHRKEHDPCAPKSRLSFCKFGFCLNVNPLELKFAIFVTFVHTSTYILFGACSNLGHSVGKSRTSLLPDMPRPLPFASNLVVEMMRALVRMF